MDKVGIIWATEDSVCKEIFKNFLTSFNRDDFEETDLSTFVMFIFNNSPTIAKDIKTELQKVNPLEHFIMIIIVTHGRQEEHSYIPSFAFPSAVRMWCSVWGAEDKTCPNTKENMRANVMLDCFLKMSNSKFEKVMGNHEKEDLVFVTCSKNAEKILESFTNFMETKIGVSTRSRENSKTPPPVALCVQDCDVEKEIKELHSVIGTPAILIMINVCEDGALLPTIPSKIDENIFPTVVRLRYSDTNKTIYDCRENKMVEEVLKEKCECGIHTFMLFSIAEI